MWKVWLRRLLLCLVLVLSSSLAYILFTRPDPNPSANPQTVAALTESDAGIELFTFLRSRDGVVQWEVRAEQAHMYEADNKALLDTVEVTLYGKGGGRELTLQGEKGTIDTEKRNFVLSNDTQPLEVELKGGYTVYTNHLAWTESTGELRTDEPVTIVGRGMVVQGQGLVGSIDSEEFQVQRNVHVQVTP